MRRSRDADTDNFYIAWGDLVSLLLVFFVYLFSISEIDVVKLLQVKESMKNEITIHDTPQNNLLADIQREQSVLTEMKQKLDTFIMENELQDVFSVTIDNHRLEMNMGNVLLFEVGDADLKQRARRVLQAVASVIDESKGLIVVEGHTDNIPVSTDQFPSNWELSSARAASVVRYLSELSISPDRFKVVGRGEYSPLVPNNTAANQAKNRRVKLTLEARLEGGET